MTGVASGFFLPFNRPVDARIGGQYTYLACAELRLFPGFLPGFLGARLQPVSDSAVRISIGSPSGRLEQKGSGLLLH
jgi:hypothetical protein